MGNALAANHTIDENGTTLTSTVLATQGNLNSNRGIASATSFDSLTSTNGFSLTFDVTSQSPLGLGANGLFLGIASSNSVYFLTAGISSFGMSFMAMLSEAKATMELG